MAIIKVFIEGGVLENPNVDLQTFNNSQRLRESFYKLLIQLFDPQDFSLQVEIGGPNNNALKFFKAEILNTPEVYLIIDLDAPKSKKEEKINGFNLDNESNKENIIFMVQEMEAWILSQPDKIETCFKFLKRKLPHSVLSEDRILKGVHPESINKPSDKLKILLKKYFSVEKKGKWKIKEYKKLKDGADLLELLDLNLLKNDFSDVESLYNALRTKK